MITLICLSNRVREHVSLWAIGLAWNRAREYDLHGSLYSWFARGGSIAWIDGGWGGRNYVD